MPAVAVACVCRCRERMGMRAGARVPRACDERSSEKLWLVELIDEKKTHWADDGDGGTSCHPRWVNPAAHHATYGGSTQPMPHPHTPLHLNHQRAARGHLLNMQGSRESGEMGGAETGRSARGGGVGGGDRQGGRESPLSRLGTTCRAARPVVSGRGRGRARRR